MRRFSYSVKQGDETKVKMLKKHNPQDWLLDAVRATFPNVAARRGNDIVRLVLEKADGAESWKATLTDDPCDLVIHVSQAD